MYEMQKMAFKHSFKSKLFFNQGKLFPPTKFIYCIQLGERLSIIIYKL